MKEFPKRYLHSHHSGHPVDELAWYGFNDLVPWSDEEQLVDWYDHVHDELES
jgi:hypothetical protein